MNSRTRAIELARHKKVSRFVGYFNDQTVANGQDPEKPEIAAVIVGHLRLAAQSSWKQVALEHMTTERKAPSVQTQLEIIEHFERVAGALVEKPEEYDRQDGKLAFVKRWEHEGAEYAVRAIESRDRDGEERMGWNWYCEKDGVALLGDCSGYCATASPFFVFDRALRAIHQRIEAQAAVLQ